ncbi:hypothetical protein E1258_22925 [Micromonospora sp. KC207]|nr:hypothetical protein E1258_22925 [Micromonospora sp. KC207]
MRSPPTGWSGHRINAASILRGPCVAVRAGPAVQTPQPARDRGEDPGMTEEELEKLFLALS